MEMILKEGKGKLEVGGVSFDFSYSDIFPKIKITLEEDLYNPILQVVTLEKKFRDLDYEEIEIEILKRYKQTFNFLLDSTYLLKNGDRKGFTFFKSLTQKKAIRLSLTENCNYRCFFCHEEGMDMNARRESSNFEKMCELLLKMKDLNYQDLTFTGGEPLVAKNDLIRYMNFMEENDYTPDLTIVTNGYLIDKVLIERIKKYKGEFKFNFSMHSVDKESYFEIVKPKNGDLDSFDKVLKNIDMIRENGIRLKMNFVLLNGLNSSPDYIKRILEFANEKGAYCVKFLELLVTDKLNKYFNYFYSLESAIKDLGDDIFLENLTYRRGEYLFKDKLVVEFQKCTCANGCNVCPLNREINVTPQMSYYPCFILDSKKIEIDNNNVEESLREGDIVIENLIKRYGNKSPVIIKNVANEKEKVEFYYKSAFTLEEIENLVNKNSFRLDRQRAFTDYIYKSSKNLNYEKLLKLSKNSYESHYREIVQKREFNCEKNHCSIEFLTEGKVIEDKENYDRYLEHLGFFNILTLNWNIKFFKGSNRNFSIGINENTGLIYVVSPKEIDSELLNLLNLELLKEDIYKDIVKNM
ncbi:MAG: radical SAM protein [Fusobacteriaceae bacterium]